MDTLKRIDAFVGKAAVFLVLCLSLPILPYIFWRMSKVEEEAEKALDDALAGQRPSWLQDVRYLERCLDCDDVKRS